MKIKVVSGDLRKTRSTHVVFSKKLNAPRYEEKNGMSRLCFQVDTKKLDQGKIALLFRQIVMEAKKQRLQEIVFEWIEVQALAPSVSAEFLADMLATHCMMANYKFVLYKEKPKDGWGFLENVLIHVSPQEKRAVNAGIRRGTIIGEQVNACRDLANTPGGDMTPSLLEAHIRKVIGGTKVTLKTLNTKEMKKLGMGGVLGVAQGSKEDPKFLIMEYKGGSQKKPVVLVGKGVTFDSGGLDIKPAPYGVDMYLDMSGGAAVIHTILAAEKLGIKKRIIGLIPAVENMPSGESYRPGDILHSLSGKTIEVLNTDAEGRLILADALTYAEKYDPETVVDIATLTGSALVALGTRASAVFSKDDTFLKQLQQLGEECGDRVWPLPLWDEFESDIQGNYADIANMQTKGSPRDAGTIIAAMFLYQFAKKFKRWAHIDMAPRMTASHDEFLEKGAVGAPIRLLIRLLETK